jgi:3-oxoadipate CoA-transferase alpha subunit
VVKNKIWDSFDGAVADVTEGASIMMFCWVIAGTPQNLIRAICRKGVENLTIITHNFMPGWVGSHVCTEDEITTPFHLLKQVRKLITTWPRPVVTTEEMGSYIDEAVRKGELELEITSHGTMAERIRAGGSGIGGFYTPTGAGTVLEEGKEKKVIDGKEYILEKPLKADFSLIRAHKADKRGNLTYRGAGRSANPIMAMAADITIAEADDIVEVGELDPEDVVTPGIFVDRIIKIPDNGLGSYQQREELRKKYLIRSQK